MASFLEQLFKSGGARKKVSNKEKRCRAEGLKACTGSKRQVWNGTAKRWRKEERSLPEIRRKNSFPFQIALRQGVEQFGIGC